MVTIWAQASQNGGIFSSLSMDGFDVETVESGDSSRSRHATTAHRARTRDPLLRRAFMTHDDSFDTHSATTHDRLLLRRVAWQAHSRYYDNTPVAFVGDDIPLDDNSPFAFLNAGSNRQSLITLLSHFDISDQRGFLEAGCGGDAVAGLPNTDRTSPLIVAQAIVGYLGAHSMDDIVNLLRAMRAEIPKRTDLEQWYQAALRDSRQFVVLSFPGGSITEADIVDSLAQFNANHI